MVLNSIVPRKSKSQYQNFKKLLFPSLTLISLDFHNMNKLFKSVSIYGLGALSGSALAFGYQAFFDSSHTENSSLTSPEAKKDKFCTPSERYVIPQSYMPNKPWDKNWDRRQHLFEKKETILPDETLEKQKRSTATRHIFLIRHGIHILGKSLMAHQQVCLM